MFVLEALVLTFMTTPLVTYFYPPHLHRRIAASGANFDNITDEAGIATNLVVNSKLRFTVVLDKLEHIWHDVAYATYPNLSSPDFVARRQGFLWA
jgi:hypothetical protein